MKYILDGEMCDGSILGMDVYSRTFNYGVGVFETIKILKGKPCFLAEHHARIHSAAIAMSLEFSFSKDELKRHIGELCLYEGLLEGAIKVFCFENEGTSHVLIAVRSWQASVSESMLLTVSNVVQPSNAWSTMYKTLNYANNFLSLREAQKHGYSDCLFLNEHRQITETSIANLFFISEGKVKTPSIECGLLDGIIRAKVIKIAEELSFLVEEGVFSLAELKEADCVFLTNSLRGVVTVQGIDFDGDEVRYSENASIERISMELQKVELEDLV